MTPLGGRLRPIRIPILTARLALRLPELTDVPLLVRYLNDPRVSRGLRARHASYTRAEEVGWVKNSRQAARHGGKLNVAITLRETGELLGGIGLEVPDWDNGHGWTGYWLMPQHWHHGYGVEAASAVCELAFQQLKLHRIDAAVFVFNARSIRLLRKLGFKKEGETREVLYRGGRWHNEYRFGLLASEFRKAQKLA